jgi:hypothetical protein
MTLSSTAKNSVRNDKPTKKHGHDEVPSKRETLERLNGSIKSKKKL